MPKELPGFYYDAEKNRYFPYKGPIPGSTSKPPSVPTSTGVKQADDLCGSTKVRQQELLQTRELCGNVISSRKGRISMQAEYQKRRVSKPLVWKYKGTKKIANFALEHAVANVTVPQGLMERDVLFSAGANGLLRLFQVGMARKDMDPMHIYKANRVWSVNQDPVPRHKELLRYLGSSDVSMMYMSSDVSCIKGSRSSSFPTNDASPRHLLITTLGSDRSPGVVYLLDLSKPLDFNAGVPPWTMEGVSELATFRQTLWNADCDSEGRRAAIGTNRGVILLDVATGVSSLVLRCKSDVLSVQIDQSSKLIIAGLRSGAIVTVDSRQRHIKRSSECPSTVKMPSSVCCLTSLKTWDQYFLASSMDGSISLYDHRMLQRGPVQSYESNVNSHTRIKHGIDPSEKVVMSGGEDCYLRLWDIKSGELLFKDKLTNSIPSAVCWSGNAGGQRSRWYWDDHYFGAWVGSYDEIIYMDWP